MYDLIADRILRTGNVVTHRRQLPAHPLPYTLKRGAELYSDMDDSSGLFEVTSGVLRLSRVTRNGHRNVIAFRFHGDFVGFCPNGFHVSDCEAVTDSTVIRYRPDSLDADDGNPRLHRKLVRAALQEIEALQERCMLLGYQTARDRAAAFLCVLAGRIGVPLGQYVEFNLPMSRADIAAYLNLSIETVSRTLTGLRKSGLITIQNTHTIVLLQPQELAELTGIPVKS